MERTLKVVEARHAIEDLVFSYAEAIDLGHIERLVELLADCTLTMPDGSRLQGGAAIADHYRSIIRFYDDDDNEVSYRAGACTPRTRHVTTNLQYEFAGDVESADVRCCFTVYQHLDGANTIVAGGRYVDRFEATASGWRIRERAIHVDHPGDMTHHVRESIT